VNDQRSSLSVARDVHGEKLAIANSLPRCSPEDVDLDSTVLANIGPAVQKFIDRGRIPGAVVMVARHGKVVFFEAFGQDRIDDNREYRCDTLVRVYSMTKPATSVAAMMLVEEGKLALADDISRWIPELEGLRVHLPGQPAGEWPQATPITVYQLLCHTAGFTYGYYGDSYVDRLYGKSRLLSRGSTLDQMAVKLGALPLASQPGSQWRYSIATDVLGLLIQRVSGVEFDHFLQERIFEPLEMSDTSFHVPSEKQSRLADSYLLDSEGKLQVVDAARTSRVLKRPDLFSGGGGLVSTAEDYMRFCLMLTNLGQWNGNRLLAPETVQQMTTNQLSPEMMPIDLAGKRVGVGFGYGFSVVVGRVPLATFTPLHEYGWGGAASTHFWISPQHDLVGIALTQKMPFTLDLENHVKRFVYRAVKD